MLEYSSWRIIRVANILPPRYQSMRKATTKSMTTIIKTVTYREQKKDVYFFKDLKILREWFANNHSTSTDIWIGYYKKSANKLGTPTYKDCVDMGLCFGWIDGIVKSIDDESYTNRFTPRRPKSNWSDVNLRRFEELRQLNLIAESGYDAFNRRIQGKNDSTNIKRENSVSQSTSLKNRKRKADS